MKLFTYIKDKIAKIKHDRFLRNHDMTEDQYQRLFDPDRNGRADTVSGYYHGYKYQYVFVSTREAPFTLYPEWTTAYSAMVAWCKNNCRGKWREDILRVSRKRLWHRASDDSMHYSDEGEWLMDELGGGDALFFAFQDDRDYTMFLLRWT